MKETIFHFGLGALFCEKGNYAISVDESIIFDGKIYYVTSVMHHFDTKYKTVMLRDFK